MLKSCTLATGFALASATLATADRSTPTMGMMNWLTPPIMEANAQSEFVSFVSSTTAPSVAGGWIIQEVADTIEGGANYPQVDAYVSALDAAGAHLSLNYGDTNWAGDQSSVAARVQSILNYLSACTATLVTNVVDGHPTIDINLDVEPKHPATWQDWTKMAGHVRTLVDQHNASDPAVRATLSGFISMGLQSDLISNAAMGQAWAGFDTLIVMAYRNLPCFSAPCQGTDAAPCADGFAKWGADLADTVPQGKSCAIALELGFDGDAIGSYCWKLSFGCTGIVQHPGTSDPVAYRCNYLNTAMAQAWAIWTPQQQAKFHSNGAFILHSYQWLSCFRDDQQAIGGGACTPAGACGDATACVPSLAGSHADVNLDGLVDALDLVHLQTHLGTCHHDSTLDGTVNVDDLLELISRWGLCDPAP